jgi:hypothetical protein
MQAIAGATNFFTNWTGMIWPDAPFKQSASNTYELKWSSSTSPPVISPFDFAAYGYGSCSAWSTLLTYAARAVGVPARQTGTPCWNDVYGDVNYTGLAKHNANVTICWHGGATKPAAHGNKHPTGGLFLNNHNWVEWWDDELNEWVFMNVPPVTGVPDAGGPGNCAGLDRDTIREHGCGWDATTKTCGHVQGGPGAAMRDHEIFAYTWADVTTDPGTNFNGGEVLSAKDLRLSNGEEVSPMVWSPYLSSPVGQPLKNDGLRVVNRTSFYRCRDNSKEIEL